MASEPKCFTQLHLSLSLIPSMTICWVPLSATQDKVALLRVQCGMWQLWNTEMNGMAWAWERFGYKINRTLLTDGMCKGSTERLSSRKNRERERETRNPGLFPSVTGSCVTSLTEERSTGEESIKDDCCVGLKESTLRTSSALLILAVILSTAKSFPQPLAPAKSNLTQTHPETAFRSIALVSH